MQKNKLITNQRIYFLFFQVKLRLNKICLLLKNMFIINKNYCNRKEIHFIIGNEPGHLILGEEILY